MLAKNQHTQKKSLYFVNTINVVNEKKIEHDFREEFSKMEVIKKKFLTKNVFLIYYFQLKRKSEKF